MRQRHADDFGDFVGMMLSDRGFEFGKQCLRALDQRQRFTRFRDLFLPAVDGGAAGKESNASRELLFHQGHANLSRRQGIGKAANDENGIKGV